MDTFENVVNLFPQKVKNLLETNKLLREREDYHPEENAWMHIKIVTERGISTGIPELIFAGLFHDITKFMDHTIHPVSGHPTSLYHDLNGAEVASKYVNIFGKNKADVDTVIWLCSQHMRVKTIKEMRPKKREALLEHPYWPLMEIFQRMDNMLIEFEY